MISCEMAGCVDSAELTAEFTSGEKMEICESCGRYWLEQPEQPKITRHRRRKVYAITALETDTLETKKRLVIDLCDYCPSRYPAAVKFVEIFDQWQKASWLEPINPLAGSDWLATWCDRCGPQHRSELDIRAWKEKKNQHAKERATK
jgi:hypothetical protein